MTKYDATDGGRFAVEHVAAHDAGPIGRERELAGKLHDLLTSPFAEPVARILEETHRLIPQGRMAGAYE
jgi:hypothetical protein